MISILQIRKAGVVEVTVSGTLRKSVDAMCEYRLERAVWNYNRVNCLLFASVRS